MLLWLNTNSGAALVGLTLVYTIATIALVYMNLKTIKEMQITRKQLTLPQVVLEFNILRRGLCCLIIKNCGHSIAKNVSVQFSTACIENLLLLDPKNEVKMKKLSAGKILLAPQQREVYDLCPMVGKLDELGKVPIEGKLEYKNIFGEITADEFCIDVMAYEHALLYGTDTEEAAKTIKDGLGEIATKIDKVKKVLEDK
jgi:hypothetical protein